MTNVARYMLNIGHRGGADFDRVVAAIREMPLTIEVTKGRVMSLLVEHFLENPPPGNWLERTLRVIKNREYDARTKAAQEREALRVANAGRGERTRPTATGERSYRKQTYQTDAEFDASVPPPAPPLPEDNADGESVR